MTTYILPAIRISCLLLLILLSTGCSGLKMWEKGKYYKTELKADIDSNKYQSVGIYVFSDGEAIDGTEQPFDAAELVEKIIMLPINLLAGTLNFNSIQVGLTHKFYPSEVTKSSTFEPDTTNAGPSLELASAIKEKLAERGYRAVIVTDLGHSGEISAERCIAHAKAAGYDAAFIVNYAGLSSWTQYAGTDVSTAGFGDNRRTITTVKVNTYTGYLYLPNAGFFDASNGTRLWSNTNYGVVENAHVPNLSGEPFIKTVSDAMLSKGDDSYFKAAPKAATVLFEPAMWPDSFKEFPARGDKKRRM